MNDLERVKECAEALVEKIEHLEASALRSCAECEEQIKTDVAMTCAPCVKLEEATCSECKCKLTSDDGYCDDCGSPPDCDGCGNQILSGHCSNCNDTEVREARRACRGRYPTLGISHMGDVNDQLLAFLTIIPETCCGAEPRPCARCADARWLHEALIERLGEVRA